MIDKIIWFMCMWGISEVILLLFIAMICCIAFDSPKERRILTKIMKYAIVFYFISGGLYFFSLVIVFAITMVKIFTHA